MSREMVICVLNEPGRLHEVLAAFLEAGVPSSTVIESQGMGRILSHDVPLFAGFRQMFQGSKPYNHTIFAVVENREMAEQIVTLVRDVLGDMKDKHKGIIFSVPVGLFERLSKE